MSVLDEKEEEEQQWWIITVKSYKIFQRRWELPEGQKNLQWWGSKYTVKRDCGAGIWVMGQKGGAIGKGNTARLSETNCSAQQASFS